ncbi:MAG: hypothetical protein Q8R10_10135 [Pseudomonas sp.]|uniref:hypothetical protein n=1 Tax=Pseudomonas sp. TaxID=306 RepID=UPI002734D6CB|nr:hypothetical protein [Pseudomonas sp.]MDP3846764.1 hypothetical protein [Pseudomonas sp.]
MICRIVPAVLLSLSLSLSGCAVYDLDSPRYSSSRYSGYGYQQSDYRATRSDYGYRPSYPVVRYREYPAPVYRYPARQPVYIYRQAPSRYDWQGYRADDRHDRRAYQRDQRERYERHERHERDGDRRRDRDDYRGRDEHHGWEVRRN